MQKQTKLAEWSPFPVWWHDDHDSELERENAHLRAENARLHKLNDQLFAVWLHRLGGGK